MTAPQLIAMLQAMNDMQEYGEKAQTLLTRHGFTADLFYRWKRGEDTEAHVRFFNICELFGWDCTPKPKNADWYIPQLLGEIEELRTLVRSLEKDRERARGRLQKGGGPDGSLCTGDGRLCDVGVEERDHRGRRGADLTTGSGRTVGTVRPGHTAQGRTA